MCCVITEFTIDIQTVWSRVESILVQLSNDIFLLKRVSRYGRCFMIDSGSKGCPDQESAGCHFGTLGRNFLGAKTKWPPNISKQRFLRRNGDDGMAGDNAFIQGASTSNQRIEQWWGFLRRECAEYWIDLFNKMEIDGKFDGTYLDVNLIPFCFMYLVQVNSINISTLQFVHVNIMFERDLYHMMLLFSKHGKLLLLPLLLIRLLLLLL